MHDYDVPHTLLIISLRLLTKEHEKEEQNIIHIVTQIPILVSVKLF